MTTIIKTNKTYNLEERTSNFAKEIIRLCRETPKNSVTIPIISQLVRAGTSVGANYREAKYLSAKKNPKKPNIGLNY